MASLRSTPSQHLIAVALSAVLLCLVAARGAAEQPRGFLRSQRPAPKPRQQKLSHFRFYFHDIVSGRNPTAVQVVRSAATSRFGAVFVIDDPLTEGPELSSKPVGRAQGMFAVASQSELGLLMAMNFAFTEGKYNGSTIAILGRNTVFSEVREMPVIGGSGLFRFARGYCQARTHVFDLRSGNAVVEYNLFLLHQPLSNP